MSIPILNNFKSLLGRHMWVLHICSVFQELTGAEVKLFANHVAGFVDSLPQDVCRMSPDMLPLVSFCIAVTCFTPL